MSKRRQIRSENHPRTAGTDPNGRLLARLRDIRQQVEADTYLTDEKIEVVVDCLCEVLNKGRKRARRATA